MLEVLECMTLCVDPRNGTFYVAWGKGVPEQYKLQMRASFGSMFKDLPDEATITNREKVAS